MKTYKLFSVVIILALLLAALPTADVSAAGTVEVIPSDVGVSWFINDTRSGGSSAFVNGPGSAPLGVGSLQFTTTDTMGGSSQAKAQLFNYQFGSFGVPGDGVALADIDAMSYWAYRASTSTNSAAQTISLNMEVDYLGDGTSYTTLVFEPVYQPGGVGAMMVDTWQMWDAYDGGNAVWWSTKNIPGVCAFSCYVPWSTILANNPDAEIKYAFGFNVGSGWAGEFEGYADALAFGVAGDTTTYNFEPVIQCTSVCYADVNTGDDTNGGASPSDAKKTIQAAIDQVDSGGTVIAAAGTYSENLDIAKPLTIQGAGNGTNPSADTIIDASGRSFGIYMHRPANLSDLRITGANYDGIRVYRLSSDLRLTFENATWQNIASVSNGAKGVEVHNDTDVSNLTIINSEFVGNVGPGLRTGSNVTVDGLTITDSLFNQNSYGVYLQGRVNGLTLLRSSFNDSVGGYGGYMTESGSLTNMVIEDSQFNRNVVGLMVWNQDDNSDLSISGTVFQDNDKWGTLIWGNTLTNVLIQNSDVLNNDGMGAGFFGIDFYAYTGVMNNVAVNYTNLIGHTAGGGLKNRNAVDSAQVNATCNWWGAVDGPSGSGMGSGDAVTDYVTFTPWLVSEAPDGPCTGMPDSEGPVTTEVVADPNPAAVGSSVTLTANVDDTNTGGSNIASAEYSLDGGPWTPMSASDGAFDKVSEDVTANFTAPDEPGIYNLCVRGIDEPGNVGDPECIMFVVYDPSGGFVTGGGWINSPEGAMSSFDAVWDQDFSLDDAGWLDDDDAWYGDITVAGGTAIFYGDSSSAPFSRFDGYRSTWPGTWVAEIDVYLDPAWPSEQGFDYSVAASGSDGAHQRDYIFHVGVVENYGPITGKALLVNGSNNADFSTNPYKLVNDNGGNYYTVTTSGWYTLQHVFRDAGGYLAVDLNLLDSSGSILWTATRENIADTIPGEVGGNRYAWFTHIDVASGIQVDNHQLFINSLSPEGKATFGFVSKYKKGASVPEGNTEFQFKAGGLNFHSTSYEWLVVTGSNYAKFKGSGTINGQGNYKFQIWAGDGAPDTFRIKIWYEEYGDEVVVYDNGMDQIIGGGSIVVHKGK